jgi:phage terminase large subunit-like protein
VYDIQCIAADIWNATHCCTILRSKGFTIEKVSSQSYDQTIGCKRMLDVIHRKKLRINKQDPVLEWMSGNAEAVYDNKGGVRLDKGKDKDKIDGIYCLSAALVIDSRMEKRNYDIGLFPGYQGGS